MGRSALTASLLGTAFVAAIAATTPAYAIDAKCYEGPAAVAALKAELATEGQQPIFMGGRTTDNRPVNLFFANENGSKGYLIEGTARVNSGQASTSMCVKAKFRDVHMNDATQPGIPSWALVGSDAKVAQTAISTNKLGSSAPHDDSVKLGAKNGYGVVMAATTRVATGSSERDGPMILVQLKPTEKIASVSLTGGNGVQTGLTTLMEATYTAHGAELLNRKIQTAALSPSR